MKNFDADLGMFREEMGQVDYRRLGFVRWLVEQGRLEHPPVGPPSGPFADRLPEGAGLARAVADACRWDPPTLTPFART